MADETEGQTPPPADHAAELAAERKERERIAAENARLQSERDAIARASEQERAQWAQWAQGVQAQLAASQRPQEPVQQEDLDGVITRRDVNAMMVQAQQNWMNQVGQTMAQQTLAQLQAQRVTNKRLAASDPSMPHFARFIAEIDAILNSVDARVAAQENAYRQTYEIVKARHYDELMAEEKARWQRGGSEEEEEQPGTAAPAQFQAPNPRAAVMPTPTGTTPARGASRRPRREAIDQFEQVAIQRHFNGDVSAYEKALAETEEEDPYDMLGMNGRRKA